MKRTEITFANVVFAMLVVFIHVSSEPITKLDTSSWQYLMVMFPWRLSAFVVQGFVLLSSLKFFLQPEITNYKKYYIRRVKTILIPYVLWNVVYYIYFCDREYFACKISDLINYILDGKLVAPFYFIIIIVQFYIFMPLWQKIYRVLNPWFLIGVSLIITLFVKDFTIPFMNRIPAYLIFWTIGAVIGVNYTTFKKYIEIYSKHIAISFVIILSIQMYMAYNLYVLDNKILYTNQFHIAYCISAIIFVLLIGRHVKSCIIDLLDNITFDIYLSHCLFLFLINEYMETNLVYNVGDFYIIRILFVYISSIIYGLLAYFVKQTIKTT
ncbi:MAG: hypothetical protein BEN19_05470 [Epulopiscium sp. Nuni2H_MBin003]|nr:MAG: hypothetical protein BEN19_05470 [Epulopiscium sp. Nuni2H_MBin003]